MKSALQVLVLLVISVQAEAADLNYWSDFKSVDAFVSAIQSFHPVSSPGDLATLFTVRELGQPDDPKTGKPVPATDISSCKLLWSDSSQALVLAIASPKTEAARSAAGVMFLLHRIQGCWQNVDHRHFTAVGKYADVTAKVSNFGYSDKPPDGPPLVTITESQGGRGYSYELSATYTIKGNRLERMDLE
jgi:hypothetical protein